MHHDDRDRCGYGCGMTSLAPAETGLPFAVFVWPRGKAQHGPRVMVTLPRWGAHPAAVYSVYPFEFVAGTDWLTADQTARLARRFRALGFPQPVVIGVDEPPDGLAPAERTRG